MRDDKQPLKINLGSGRSYLADYVNCDVVASVKADKYFDLNQFPYPFEDACASLILLDNVLEHLDDVIKVVEEAHRILIPGGVLEIKVPYGKTDWALQDPTHKHYFTEMSMEYFKPDFAFNFYTKARFNILEARLFGDSTTLRHRIRNALPFKGALKMFFWNIYDGIHFKMEKI